MSDQEPLRSVPVKPNLRHLKIQAKEFLRDVRAGVPSAIDEFKQSHPNPNVETAKLSDAQFALARSYGVSSWPRLVQACRLIDAIWRADRDELRELLTDNPSLLHENARATKHCNWGPPMSYAANLGRNEI